MLATHHALLELVGRLTFWTANDRHRLRVLEHTNLNSNRFLTIFAKGFDDLRLVLLALSVRHRRDTQHVTIDQQAITGLEFDFQSQRASNV